MYKYVFIIIGSFLPYIVEAFIPLPNTPDWQSGPSSSTMGIALGDVNNDGFLDLVATSDYGPSQLYINNSGTLETNPSWVVPDSGMWLTFGDFDRDGDQDLVICGCAVNTLIKLHKNRFIESGAHNCLILSPFGNQQNVK